MSLGESQVAVSHSRDATVSSHTKGISFVTVLISPRGNVPESRCHSEVGPQHARGECQLLVLTTTQELQSVACTSADPAPSCKASFKVRSLFTAPPYQHPCRHRNYQRQHHQTSFRTCRSSAPQRVTRRMRREQMAFRQQTAVWRSIQIRLAPVPSSMEAYSPPQRLGVPKTEAENETAKTDHQQSQK